MLTGDRAATPQRFERDFARGGAYFHHGVSVTFVSQVSRMEITVTGVAKRRAGNAVPARGLFNKTHHRGEFAARHRNVFQNG